MIFPIPGSPRTVIVVFLIVGTMGNGSSMVMAEKLEAQTILETRESVFEYSESQPYTYRVGNRRDPFFPLRFSSSPDHSEETPLFESIEPEGALTLLGIISGKGGYQALLKLPNGERLIVGPGSSLSILPGAIKEISRDRVVIVQPVDDGERNRTVESVLKVSP